MYICVHLYVSINICTGIYYIFIYVFIYTLHIESTRSAGLVDQRVLYIYKSTFVCIICTCLYVSVCVCFSVGRYVHMPRHVCVCVRVHMHLGVHVCARVCVFYLVCVYVHTDASSGAKKMDSKK